MDGRAWEILSQRQAQRIGADGRTQDIYEITWVSRPSGTVSIERIPLTDYAIENVARIIEERHSLVEAVHSL